MIPIDNPLGGEFVVLHHWYVRAITEKIGPDLTLSDLRDFIGTDVGSGRYIYVYEVDGGDYQLIINVGGYEDTNGIVEFGRVINGKMDENATDIRYYDVDKYIIDGTRELVRPLPESKATTDLETAISQAILEANKDGNNRGDFTAEAHTTLKITEDSNKVTA